MNIQHAVLSLALIALPLFASSAQSTTYKQRHTIQARQNRQQARISKGVQDGQITPKGAAVAEHNQARIASRENSMRAADGGHLTATDRHQLAREQDRTSKGIYDRNHNRATDPGVVPNTPH